MRPKRPLWTSLMVAVAGGSLRATRLILGQGVDAQVKSKNGWTALKITAQLKHQDIVNVLLQSGIKD